MSGPKGAPAGLFPGGKGGWLLVLGLAAGLLLVFFGGRQTTAASPVELESPEDPGEAVSELERRVAALLEAMDGVSDVRVVLTPESGSELVYAQNVRYENGVASEKQYVFFEQNGDGRPIPVKYLCPRIRGAAVVCRGGSHPVTQEKILSLLEALLDLPAGRIFVTG